KHHMSALIDFVPRFDSGSQFSGVGFVDTSRLGRASFADDGESIRFDGLGVELVNDEYAIAQVAHKLAERWHMDPTDRRVQDAAGQFVTGPLEKLLGPSSDVVRGLNKPYVFVPGNGRTPAIPSLNEL